MVWFNVAVILEPQQEISEEHPEAVEELADCLLAPHHYDNTDEHGHIDRTESYQYGTLHAFDPAYCHAILTPEGIWLAPDPVQDTPITEQEYPELSKFYWLRDTHKAQEELARLNAADDILENERQARWQAHVEAVFKKFATRYVIRVRCHI